jgi:proline iminopeptidase
MPSQLSEHLRLVFVDLRGGGRSSGDPTTLTFDQLDSDFEAVRVALGVERIAVIGHSIMGALAIEYGRRCPAAVSHVITVGLPPRGDMAWLWREAMEFFERDASDVRKDVLRDNLARLPSGTPLEQAFPAQAPLRFYDPRTEMMPLYQGAIFKPALLGHVLGSLTGDWDVTRDASSLRVPILLTHGRYDYTVPYTLWEGIEALLPSSTRHLFKRSGHQPFLEEPDEFATVVTAWMRKSEPYG